MTRITLTRKSAAIKLESASKATYYFQREDRRYERDVPVADMVAAFRTDPRARLRIDLATSRHTVTLVEGPCLATGYSIEFT